MAFSQKEKIPELNKNENTGMTQRDGMGREEGEGFRMGNTCIPVADSFRYMAKPIHTVKLKNKIKLKK